VNTEVRAESDNPPPSQPPSIALALSGGGARGLAGIGVLKAFEERGIQVNAIAGTSIGGIVGGLYACGYSADQIKSIVEKIDFNQLFANDPPRASMLFTQRRERERHLITIRFKGLTPQIPHALTGGQELTFLLTELTLVPNYRAGGKFANLKIPFKTVCTDIVSGKEIIIDTGSLADAMRATMAFPLAFTGVEQGNRLLMDGGILTPVPVALARSMADHSLPVVAVNSTSPLLTKEQLHTPVDIANQVTSIMGAGPLRAQLDMADYVITPELNGISSVDFRLRDSIMLLGYQAALKIADAIVRSHSRPSSIPDPLIPAAAGLPTDRFSRLVVHGVTAFPADSIISWLSPSSDSTTASSLHHRLDLLLERYHKAGYHLASVSSVTLDSSQTAAIEINEGIVRYIDVVKDGKTRDWVVRSYFPVHKGQPFALDKSLRGVREIYGTDLFDRVTLQAVPVDSGARILLNVRERPSLQARLGWHWDDHYQSEEFLEILNDNLFGSGVECLAHGRYGLDRRAVYGEIRANRILSTYLTGQVRAGWSEVDRTTYDTSGNPFGIRTESRWGLTINAGQQIARLGTITGGIGIERVRHNDKSLPKEEFNLNTFNFESHVETFDRVTFPTGGRRLLFRLRLSSRFLGSDYNFTRFNAAAESYYSFSRNYTYRFRLSVGLSADTLPLSEKFYLGGATSLNGYRGESLFGDKYALVNQEIRLKLPLGFYITARWDMGDIAVRFDRLKLRNVRQGFGGALSLDTPVGPFELGYGRTNRGGERWYFSAGLEF
jgi:NTE family protein